MADDLLTRIRLYVATELALGGAYLRAETVLTGSPGTPLLAKQLDLLARIYVHQERFAEAQACWEQAAAIGTDNQAYRSAMSVLQEHQERLRLRHRITRSLYAFMALIALAAVLLLLLFHFTA